MILSPVETEGPSMVENAGPSADVRPCDSCGGDTMIFEGEERA